jgi:hypothetical protein
VIPRGLGGLELDDQFELREHGLTKGVQVTAASVRSSLAPAARRA